MKALVRNDGETIIETMDIKGIDWRTGAPFTDPDNPFGPYKLIENYIPPKTEPKISGDPSNNI